MTALSFWGNLENLEAVQTPATFLYEQAKLLAKATNSILQGEVAQWTLSDSQRFEIDLRIVVPALDNYSYTVVSVTHPIELYPAKIHDYANDKEYTCANEKEFLDRLRSILSSLEVRKIIATLISQIKATSKYGEPVYSESEPDIEF